MEILLISHKGAASGMKSAAELIVGESAKNIGVLELTAEAGVEVFAEELEKYLTSWLADGKMGLIFADLKGGTPFNQAEMILAKHGLKGQAKVVSGMNLPMLLENLFLEVDQWSKEDIQDILTVGRDGIACMDIAASDEESEDE